MGQDGLAYRHSFHSDRDLQSIMFQLFDRNNETVPERKSVSMPEQKSVSDRSLTDGFEAPRNSLDLSAELMELRRQSNNTAPRNDNNKEDNDDEEEEFISIGFAGSRKKTDQPVNPPSRSIQKQQQDPMSRHIATSGHVSIPSSFSPSPSPSSSSSSSSSSTPSIIARLMGLNNLPHSTGGNNTRQARSAKSKRNIDPAAPDRPNDWLIDRSIGRPIDGSGHSRSNNRAPNDRPNEVTTTAMANLSARRRPPTPPQHQHHLLPTSNNSYAHNGSVETGTRRMSLSNVDGFLQEQAGLMQDPSSSASPTGHGSSARYLYDSDSDSQWVNSQEPEDGFSFRERHPQEAQLQEFKKQFVASSLTTSSHVATSPSQKLGFRNGSAMGSPSSSCASTSSIKDYCQMRKQNDNLQNNHPSTSPSYSSSSPSTISRHLKNLKSLGSLDDLKHAATGADSVEMVDALDFLRANRDFFLRVLHDPATGETQQRQGESSGLEPQGKKAGSSRSSSPAKQQHPPMGSRSSSPLKRHVTRKESKGGSRSTSPAKHHVTKNGPDTIGMGMDMGMGMGIRSISPVKHHAPANGHGRTGSRSTSPAKHNVAPMNGHGGMGSSRSVSPAMHHGAAPTNGHGGMGSRSASPVKHHHVAPTNGHGGMGSRSASPAKHHAAPTNGHHVITNGKDTVGMGIGMGMGMGMGNSRSTSPAKRHGTMNGHHVTTNGQDTVGMGMGMGSSRSTSPLKHHVSANVPDVCMGSNISTNQWPSSGSINQIKHNYKHHPMQQSRSAEWKSTNYHNPNEEEGALGSNSHAAAGRAACTPEQSIPEKEYVDPKRIAKEIVKQVKQDAGNRKVSNYFRHISTSLDIKTDRSNASVGEVNSAASTDSEAESCGSSSSRRTLLKSMQNSPQNGVLFPSIKLVSQPNNTAPNPSSSNSNSSSFSPSSSSSNFPSASDVDRIQKRQAAVEEIKLAKLRAAVEEVQMRKYPTFEINLSFSRRVSTDSPNSTDDQSSGLNCKNKNKQTSPIASNSIPVNPISKPVVKPITPSTTTTTTTTTNNNNNTNTTNTNTTGSSSNTHEVKIETNPAILKSQEKLLARPAFKNQLPEVHPASSMVTKKKANINFDFKAKLSSLKDSLVMTSRKKTPVKKKLLSSLSSVTGSMKEAMEFPAQKESSSPRLLKSSSAKWPHSSESWIPTTSSTPKALAHANIGVDNSLTSVHISQCNSRDPTDNTSDQSNLEKCDQQPSPVSVLDQPTFLEATGSSPIYTERGTQQMNGSRCHPRGRKKGSAERVARSELEKELPCIINIEGMLEATPPERRPDLAYIRDVLLYCGFSDNTSKLVRSFSSTHGLNPSLFQRIEEVYCMMDSEEESTTTIPTRGSKWRRLLFDMVDESLLARFAIPTTTSISPRLINVDKPSFHYMRTGKQLLYHIWMDLNSCPFYSPSSKEAVPLDKLAALDMSKSRGELAWVPMGSDMVAVGLEVERVIFNDLAQQLVSDCLSTLKSDHMLLRPRP